MDYFSWHSELLIPFLTGIILIISGLVAFYKNQSIGIILVVLGAIGMGVFAATLTPGLNIWDEQYHALVAKNMGETPFHPTLYRATPLPYNHEVWVSNHTWLHKQPLFLWLMAISIKLFGTTSFAARGASILLHGFTALFIYRIGKRSGFDRVGLIASALFSVAYFPLELISGYFSTDHNDVAFLFMVSGSVMSWFEYQSSKKRRWLIAIGLFAGGGVLVKWLMGMIVFVVWFFSLLASEPKNIFKLKRYVPMTLAFLVACAVALPWQIYSLIQFPKEAKFEIFGNGRHFFEAIEKHGGDWTFHFTTGFETLYGSGAIVPILVLLGLVAFVYRTKGKLQKIFISVFVVFVYVFFSIAATKMIAFTIIVMPLVLLGYASLIDMLTDIIRRKKKILGDVLFIGISIAFIFLALNISKIEEHHGLKGTTASSFDVETAELDFLHSPEIQNLDHKTIVFNANTSFEGHIAWMYYTDVIAYSKIPSLEEVKTLRSQGYKIACLTIGGLPEEIRTDSEIQLLDYPGEPALKIWQIDMDSRMEVSK